jgi:hypothetical protein
MIVGQEGDPLVRSEFFRVFRRPIAALRRNPRLFLRWYRSLDDRRDEYVVGKPGWFVRSKVVFAELRDGFGSPRWKPFDVDVFAGIFTVQPVRRFVGVGR